MFLMKLTQFKEQVKSLTIKMKYSWLGQNVWNFLMKISNKFVIVYKILHTFVPFRFLCQRRNVFSQVGSVCECPSAHGMCVCVSVTDTCFVML